MLLAPPLLITQFYHPAAAMTLSLSNPLSPFPPPSTQLAPSLSTMPTPFQSILADQPPPLHFPLPPNTPILLIATLFPTSLIHHLHSFPPYTLPLHSPPHFLPTLLSFSTLQSLLNTPYPTPRYLTYLTSRYQSHTLRSPELSTRPPPSSTTTHSPPFLIPPPTTHPSMPFSYPLPPALPSPQLPRSTS